jgi:Aminotransferase class I and II
MAERIITMRALLKKNLEDLGSKHDWSHITNQIGMFAYTGLTAEQMDKLAKEVSFGLPPLPGPRGPSLKPADYGSTLSMEQRMDVSQSRALLLEMLRDLPRPFTLSRDKGTIFV